MTPPLHKVDRLLYDDDSSVLSIMLTTGAEYLVTNAGHARELYKKLRPGQNLTSEQLAWVACYKTAPRRIAKESLISKLRNVRKEIKSGFKRAKREF